MAKPPRLDEFQRIARYFAPLAGPGALGLTDDVALIDGPADTQYVLKTDAIVEGIHFFPTDPPGQIAQKLLRVNLSDLAAKGASPFGYLLAIALRADQDEAWLEAFSAGLAADQKEFGITLLGGDSDRIEGPAALTVTAIGTIEKGRALLRRGAKAGDTLYVSGTLGDGALGLLVLKGELTGPGDDDRRHLIDRYRLPRPRLALGRQLLDLASAAMDISDGLVADAGHLAEASGVAIAIEAARLPLSPAARRALEADPTLIRTVLTGGDDYEILFTAPALAGARIRGLPVTAIGEVKAGRGVIARAADGSLIALDRPGYRHF